MQSNKITFVIASSIVCLFMLLLGSTHAFSQSFGWVVENSMLEARDQFTGGVIGGKIYVFGGNGNPDEINLKSTEIFDPATHLWTYKSSNENNNGQGVEELTGAVFNDKLYVFGAEGGGTPYGVFNFVQEYDPAADTWTSKAPKPTIVSGATAAVYDGEIFLFGGGYSNTETTSRIYYNVVEAYNPTENTWRPVTNMPYNLGHMAVSIIGTKAYLVGGYDRDTGNLQQNIIAYDFVSNQWITEGLGELSAPRLFFYASSAPIVDGKIYLVGGWTNVGWNFTDESNLSITNEVQIYDPSSQSFSLGPSLPQAIDDFLTLSTNNYIYVLGGETDWENSISTNAVWRLDLAPKTNIIPIISLLLDDDINGFTYAELLGNTFEITDIDFPTCVEVVTFINNEQYIVPEGGTYNYTITNGCINVRSNVDTGLCIKSRIGEETIADITVFGGEFVDRTDQWGTDFSIMNNDATALKDWFVTNGWWAGSAILADGRVTNQDASFDGKWWIDNNVLYIAHPESDGCVDYKAYKLVNDRLMFATDAAHTETFSIVKL